MFIDALGEVSVAQALSTASTIVSTNVIDLGVPGPNTGTQLFRQIGTGESVGFAIAIGVGANYTANETYTINIIESAAAAMSAPTILASLSITAAQANAGVWAAGTLLFLQMPIGQPTQEFIALQYVLAGTTPTITLTAWLTTRSLFSALAVAYPKSYVS